MVINNLSADGISASVEAFANELKTSQMVFIPGGFSGGDEPDGSGKFITAFFRNLAIKEQFVPGNTGISGNGAKPCSIMHRAFIAWAGWILPHRWPKEL